MNGDEMEDGEDSDESVNIDPGIIEYKVRIYIFLDIAKKKILIYLLKLVLPF